MDHGAEDNFDNTTTTTDVRSSLFGSNTDENCLTAISAQQQEEESSDDLELKKEIVIAICRALMVVNEMQGSIKDIEDVLTFPKGMFCRSDQSLISLWPKKFAQEVWLQELAICLDESHPGQYDVMGSNAY